MKKVVALVIVFAFVAGLVLITNDIASAWGKDKKKKEEESKVAEQVSPEQELPKLLYKFKNDEEIAEFEQLYIAKQATFGRMGVLQAYFAMEQNNLTEIDRQVEEKFGLKMDPSKMYDLNRETMELKEVGVVPEAASPPAR